ncbi:MAG: AAA family ATPase [Desulfovibrionaceae bacterium]|nr:AAA family ATPase [Desulfovibrionaceae bacterium]
MAQLNILIGGDSFKKIREEQRCYVDKTAFIEEFLALGYPEVSLITRPRRFGKTLMLTMLKEFFDINAKERNLFEALAISKNEQICAEWFHQYPTIFLTLKGVEGGNFSHAIEKFAAIIQRLISEKRYLLASDTVFEEDKEKLLLFQKRQINTSDLEDSLLILCQALEAHHGKPVILLIDEYDVPISCAEENGYYKEMIGFMRNMLGAALKTNPSLKFAVLTGCLRIARESIFTGLNNFKCFGISDDFFADKFGFTAKDVDGLLACIRMPNRKKDIQEWYDGYRFGQELEIYCPWDVLQYIYDLQRNAAAQPQAYWKNTSNNAIVRRLVEKLGQEIREKIEDLIAAKPIEERLEEDLTYDTVYKKDRALWTMMYLTGYLTKAANQPDNRNTALVIPNKEIREIFIDKVASWFEDCMSRQDLRPLATAIWNGEDAYVRQKINEILYDTISYFDSGESFYHGFLAELLRGAGLVVKSNRENGLGRTDIVIQDAKHKRAAIFELKKAAEYEDLEKRAAAALVQIEEKKYAADMPPNIQTVLKYGIAFWKKECAVKILESERSCVK